VGGNQASKERSIMTTKDINIGHHIGYFKLIDGVLHHSFDPEDLPWHRADSMLGNTDAFANLVDYIAFVAIYASIERMIVEKLI